VDMWAIGVITFILLGGYLPFKDDGNISELFTLISKGKFEFHPQFWANVSLESKDLISGLITVNVKKRLTADDVLRHPWICKSDNILAAINLDANLVELKRFNEFKKAIFNQNHNHTTNYDLMVMFLILSSPQRNEDIFNLLDCHPEICEECDQLGRLLLHVAIEYNNSKQVILSILAANLNAAKIKDNQNRLPLLLAINSKTSAEVVTALIAAYPDACKMAISCIPVPPTVNSSGAVSPPPIVNQSIVLTSLAATFNGASSLSKLLGVSGDFIPMIPNSNPSYISLFHTILELQYPVGVISAWLSYHPTASSERSHTGLLPLHTAMEAYGNVESSKGGDSSKGAVVIGERKEVGLYDEVIILLLHHYPQATYEIDLQGRLPLFVAFEKKMPNTVLKLLLTIYPDACKYYHKELGLPLHVALKNRISTEILLMIISINIDACREEDCDGNMAIALAHKYFASPEVIKAISFSLSIDFVKEQE